MKVRVMHLPTREDDHLPFRVETKRGLFGSWEGYGRFRNLESAKNAADILANNPVYEVKL